MRNKARAGLPRQLHPPGLLAEAARPAAVEAKQGYDDQMHIGEWRSLVARSLREREAAGSNPAFPTQAGNPGSTPGEASAW
jgi:hypothetical protein